MGYIKALDEYIKIHYNPVDLEQNRLCEDSAPYRGYYQTVVQDDDNSGKKRKIKSRKPKEKSFSDWYCHTVVSLPNFEINDSFAESLVRWMRKKDLTSTQLYYSCNITRSCFSRLLNPAYHPGKDTVMALCIGLRLNRLEADQFLAKAGYALSDAIMRDVIVAYCIEQGFGDGDFVNRVLIEYEEKPLTGEI